MFVAAVQFLAVLCKRSRRVFENCSTLLSGWQIQRSEETECICATVRWCKKCGQDCGIVNIIMSTNVTNDNLMCSNRLCVCFSFGEINNVGMCTSLCVCVCVWAAVTGTDLWSDRANLPSYYPALLILSCSKWLSDQLALKLNTLTDLEENQNQFVPGPSIWSCPPWALELVTSPWCGIDVLTRKVRLKKRPRENKGGVERERERERKN